MHQEPLAYKLAMTRTKTNPGVCTGTQGYWLQCGYSKAAGKVRQSENQFQSCMSRTITAHLCPMKNTCIINEMYT